MKKTALVVMLAAVMSAQAESLESQINSLLSGPRTHVVNFVGNALTSIYSLPEQALTAGIGKALGSADRSFIGEVGARVTGLANASVEGLARAKKAFVTGEAADDVTKVESRVHDAIGGRVGKIVRLPTRALDILPISRHDRCGAAALFAVSMHSTRTMPCKR